MSCKLVSNYSHALHYLSTVVKTEFSSSTFDGLESSGIVPVTIIISGGVVSSKDINISVSFTPVTAIGN